VELEGTRKRKSADRGGTRGRKRGKVEMMPGFQLGSASEQTKKSWKVGEDLRY
jgi:hypothetical protein